MRKGVVLTVLLLSWLALPRPAPAEAGVAEASEDGLLWERVEYQIPTSKGFFKSILDIGYNLDLQNHISNYRVKIPNNPKQIPNQDDYYVFTAQVPGMSELFTIRAQVTSERRYRIFVYSPGSTTPYATEGALKWQWQWKTVSYQWPKLEGIDVQVSLGFLVNPEKNVIQHAVYRYGQVVGLTSQRGSLSYTENWPATNYQYTTQVHFDGNHYQIISTHNDGASLETRGILPLTEEEIVTEVIRLSKNDTAITNNASLHVNDLELARTIIFAAKSYDIPLGLFIALIYQESKFDAGDHSGDIQGPAQVSLTYAIKDCENIYFKSRDFKARLQRDSTIKPQKADWNQYGDNLLYGAAYLRHLYIIAHGNMPEIEETELWKFLMVWYNFGMGDAQNTWEKAGKPTRWNKQFATLLPEDEKRNYSGGIFFYFSRLMAGEQDLRQYDTSERNSSVRRAFVAQFNN